MDIADLTFPLVQDYLDLQGVECPALKGATTDSQYSSMSISTTGSHQELAESLM